jgi:hypothetical protein
MAFFRTLGVAFAVAVLPFACDTTPPLIVTWQTVGENLPSALMSVDGTSSKDVWAVGADKGSGPLVVHWDGAAWTQMKTGYTGDLWWVHAFPSGPVFFAGAGGQILRYDGQKFERLEVPFALARQTIFGLWGSSPSDVYAVGGSAGREGFVWHYDGASFTSIDLPTDVPRLSSGEVPGLFKVWGSASDVWVVGGSGTILHKRGADPFVNVPSGTNETLFTVHGAGGDVVVVGGTSNGFALLGNANAFKDASPSQSGILQGVYEAPVGNVWASGEKGLVYQLVAGRLETIDTGLAVAVGSLHSVYVDEKGGVWSVGGNVLSAALDGGAMIHRGDPIAPIELAVADAGADGDAAPPAVCPQSVIDVAANKSAARRWDEQMLASIRRDLPRPTVHARNLFHVSAAMWDAWAAYDTTAKGVFVKEKQTATDVGLARAEAVSYAAYRVLLDRYTKAVGGPIDVACYRAVMQAMGYDPDDATDTGTTPRALGNRIGEAIALFGATDGSDQALSYADPSPYKPVNPPLVVDDPGATLVDANLWQPLNLAVAQTQNGIILPAGVQTYIGSQWGGVTPFAMTRSSDQVPWHDAGPAPTVGDAMNAYLEEVLARSSELDPSDGVTMDASPGAYGNNTLGANDGVGRALNPITNQPYAPNVLPRADFGRAMAEFWADGPNSETPPGHWNVIANLVADSPNFGFQLYGTGAPLDALAWDVHVYLALNGAVHDAAITAWDLKRRSTSVRPISLIRWMGQNGTLPTIPGLIEPITDASCAPGQRHEHLALYKGQIAIRAWRGDPSDRKSQVAGVDWIRAVDWMPYQRRTFVTPAFPGFISGHSTFSRAAAEVLVTLTGSPYFPGGFAEYVLPKDQWLTFERGPSSDVHLQWATYYDASDQAGQSRIWGGIHITADDFAGRKLGSLVGTDAVTLAGKYFDGTAP